MKISNCSARRQPAMAPNPSLQYLDPSADCKDPFSIEFIQGAVRNEPFVEQDYAHRKCRR